MRRGNGWWGTPPLVVGVGGLLLLAVGARGMQDGDEMNKAVQERAGQVEKELTSLERQRKVAPIVEQKEIVLEQETRVLEEQEGLLKRGGKVVDLQSLAPKTATEDAPDLAAKVRDILIDAQSARPDPGMTVAERIAFYIGLILVFAAGVLLYRRTPDSVRGAW